MLLQETQGQGGPVRTHQALPAGPRQPLRGCTGAGGLLITRPRPLTNGLRCRAGLGRRNHPRSWGALPSRHTVCDRCVYDAAAGVGCKSCGHIRPVTVVPGMRPHRPRGRGAQRCPQSSSQEAAAANSPLTMLWKRGLGVFSEPGWLRGWIAPETAEYGLQPLLTAALGL